MERIFGYPSPFFPWVIYIHSWNDNFCYLTWPEQNSNWHCLYCSPIFPRRSSAAQEAWRGKDFSLFCCFLCCLPIPLICHKWRKRWGLYWYSFCFVLFGPKWTNWQEYDREYSFGTWTSKGKFSESGLKCLLWRGREEEEDTMAGWKGIW